MNIRQSIATVILLLCPFVSYGLYYPMPPSGQDIIGENYVIETQKGDSLRKLAHRHGVSFHEMVEANQTVNPWNRLKPGTEVVIPHQFILPNVPREGIVINLPELRLYYFSPNDGMVYTYPIGIGRRDEWRTPQGTTTIVKKDKDPTWYVPESIYEYVLATKGKELPEFIPPGPDNPLGKYALRLGFHGYLIHGTNAPSSVGRRVSSGCIRMYPDDIESLFYMVNTGTPVRIINHRYKAGWDGNNNLYLESHAPLSDDNALDGRDSNSIAESVSYVTSGQQANIDWDLAEQIANQQNGMPEQIGGKQQKFTIWDFGS